MIEMYKGYIKTKGKVPVEKLKGVSKFKTFDEVKDLDSYAGVLAKDIILVDIDDETQSNIMMDIVEDLQLDCRVYKTTRGRHFLFKNSSVKKCATHINLACGLIADIKVGVTNTIECLKIDGVERFIEWDTENGEYQEVPKFMWPVKTDTNFLGMKDGDGRDSALFSYILTLNKYGFTKEETRNCITLMNKYVLADKLSDEDIERITRDEAFPEIAFFDEDGRFSHNTFATFIKNECNVKRLNGQLHVYDSGVYIEGMRRIEAAMIKYIPSLKAAQRIEALKYLDLLCEEEQTADANYIAFNNGIYDLTTDKLMDFSSDIIITNRIPWDYNTQAYSDIADNVLDRLACGDKQIRALLEECIGYCFYRRNELSKAFILVGEKSNGKSTFLSMLQSVLGEGNASALNLEELDERFSTAMMFGKLANIGDDISDEFLQGKIIATFKKIVSGNEIKAEFKGQDGFVYKPYVKLLFSANEIPRTKDKTGAVLRRLVPIPLRGKFTKEDPDFDPFIIWKLKDQEVMEYLVKIGLAGLKRVLTNNDFTESVAVTKEKDEYEKNNNPILLFLEEKEQWEIENQPTKDVHRSYRIFCAENGFTEMTLANFSKELGRRCNIVVKRVRANGKQVGVYVKNG